MRASLLHMSALRVLIGGGNGFVGRALGASLSSAGHEVTNLVRTAQGGIPSLTWSTLRDSGR